MFLDGVDLLAGDGVPDLDVAAGSAEDHVAVIGRDVGAEDDVEFLADLDDAFTGLHVPGDDVAGLATAAAAADQRVVRSN